MKFIDAMVTNRQYLLINDDDDDDTRRVRWHDGELETHTYTTEDGRYSPGWEHVSEPVVLKQFPDAARQICAVNAGMARAIVGMPWQS